MNTETPGARTIFLEAIENHPPDQWSAFLESACGADDELRRQVLRLLEAHAGIDSFMAQPGGGMLPAVAATVGQPSHEPIGATIGRFKLLEKIGEGGMGVVYVAEQTEPVRRKVALKVIKPGMDSRQVVARFEAERQALALMDHPNIAKVFDGGMVEERGQGSGVRDRGGREEGRRGGRDNSDSSFLLHPSSFSSGRPYFVMELVRGLPITEYCDKARLSPDRRLALFVTVCQAVQHAHHRGIIHRDLKPTNVLVTLHDGEPVAKVIDFGVAKALNQQLSEHSIYTNLSQMIGTPLYMSPEQAELSGLDVDTRSDVYSLGVLLYELLTGQTPFDGETLKQAGLEEMRRIIREDEPPRPSQRISTLEGQALSTLSQKRDIDERRLSKVLRGELDWIVMKALEKDRTRRYETASGLAQDIQRYLADEIVEARPPSVAYRCRKFARRHKVAMAISCLALISLVTIAGSVGWAMREAAVRSEQIADETKLAIKEAERLRDEGRFSQALLMAGRASRVTEGGTTSAGLRGEIDELVRDLTLAQRLEDATSVQFQVDSTASRFTTELALPEFEAAFGEYGMYPEQTAVPQAAGLIKSRPPAIQISIIAALDQWVALERHALEGKFGQRTRGSRQRVDWLRETVAQADADPWRRQVREAIHGNDWQTVARLAASEAANDQAAYTLRMLGENLCKTPEFRVAGLDVLRRAQRKYPGDFATNDALRQEYAKDPRQSQEAMRFATAAVALRPENAGAWLNLGNSFSRASRHDEAIAIYRKAIELKPDYSAAYTNFGNALLDRGRIEEAIVEHQRAIELQPDSVFAHNNLGNALHDAGQIDEAIAEYRQAIELQPEYAEAHGNLGTILVKRGQIDEAIAECQKALELRPDFAEAHSFLGNALCIRGQIDEAIAEYQKAIELQPEYAEAHSNLGNALWARRQFDQAIAEYRKAIQLRPDLVEAHSNLGNALFQEGLIDEAIVEYETAIALRPDRAEPHDRLGRALDKVGRHKEAIAEYQRAIELRRDFAQPDSNFEFPRQKGRDRLGVQ